MIARTGNVGVVALVLVLAAACGSDAGPAWTTHSSDLDAEQRESTAPVEAAAAACPRSAEPTEQQAAFDAP